MFCSEDCITAFFTPEIERLEKEYFANLSRGDLSDDEKDKFSHLRWITLQDPDEVWREKTLAGDYRYTLISEFQPGSRGIWSVCICLFLRGEPSFLYLAFPTKNAAMVNNYRRGERVQWEKPKQPKPGKASGKSQAKKELREPRSSRDSSDRTPQNPVASDMSSPSQTDGLAEAWTEDDVQRAQLVHERQEDDIPTEEFEDYQRCMDETLETPDEVWVLMGKDEEDRRIFHFMRHYPDEKPNRVWFVIVARETETDEEIEILDAFPTRDPKLVECYRRGDQQIGIRETRNPSRVVH